jgi:carbonic anhydrase
MRFVLLVVAAVVVPGSLRAQWKTQWSYEGATGPEHWTGLDPENAACDGKEESPIDIRNAKKTELPPYDSNTKVVRSNT